jgi:hypothetical protein
MNFTFEFTSPMEVDVAETAIGVAIIKGTLLSEGISRNGNLYTLDQMEKIAKTAEGAPIFYGTMANSIKNGVPVKNAHANIEPNLVGQIMQTFLDPIAKKIRFIAKLFSTEQFPHLIEEVKQGWGVSIGGNGKARFVLDALGRILTKIFDLTVNHVQLLRPETPRGQESAQVESAEPKEIQESMIFYELPKPDFQIRELKLREGDSVTFKVY